jgi:DNA-binding MarR family transcriptional regulator
VRSRCVERLRGIRDRGVDVSSIEFRSIVSTFNPTSPDFVKEEFPFYWLARLHGVYTLEMEQALKPLGLDITTWRTLFILAERGSSSVSDISLHAVTKLSTVTKLVYRMKDEGLVDTHASPEDGRVTIVTLTDAGRGTIEKSRLAIQHIFTHSFRGITPKQVRTLNELLHTILDNLSPRHADAAAGDRVAAPRGKRRKPTEPSVDEA